MADTIIGAAPLSLGIDHISMPMAAPLVGDEDERRLAMKLCIRLLPRAGVAGVGARLIDLITTTITATATGADAGADASLLGHASRMSLDLLYAALCGNGEGSGGGDMTDASSALILLDLWTALHTAALSSSSPPPSVTESPPTQLAAVVVSLSQASTEQWHRLLPFVSAITRVVKRATATTPRLARLVLESVTPAVLLCLEDTTLTTGNGATSGDAVTARVDCQLAMVQLLLLLFSATASQENAAAQILQVVLPVVSSLLNHTRLSREKLPTSAGSGSASSALVARYDQMTAFIGKALVQLAKLYADPFRAQVAALPGASTTALQLCMRDAILAEKATGPGSGAGPAAPTMSLKIDSSKFKK